MLNTLSSYFDVFMDALRTVASHIFFLEPLTHDEFIFRPFFTILILGIVSGVLGVLVNLRKLEFISEGIIHSIFPGIILGFVLFNGVTGIVPGAIFIGIIAAFVFTTSTKHESTSEALIALTLTAFFGIGIVIVTYVKDMSGQLEALLFGRLLAVTSPLATQTFIVCALSILLVAFMWKELVFRAFDPVTYQSCGYRIFISDLLLNISLTFAIVAASTAVGTLLAIGYVIIPPATAKLVCNKISTMIPVSIFVAIFSGYLGLMAVVLFSDYAELSPQAMVICSMTLLYALAYVVRYVKNKKHKVRSDNKNKTFELAENKQVGIV